MTIYPSLSVPSIFVYLCLFFHFLSLSRSLSLSDYLSIYLSVCLSLSALHQTYQRKSSSVVETIGKGEIIAFGSLSKGYWRRIVKRRNIDSNFIILETFTSWFCGIIGIVINHLSLCEKNGWFTWATSREKYIQWFFAMSLDFFHHHPLIGR